MRGMEIQMGVIRDRPGIYAGLLQSLSLARQLAVCYNSDGKLIVKICTVVGISGENDKRMVALRTDPENPSTETVVPLNLIESIYPIRDFLK